MQDRRWARREWLLLAVMIAAGIGLRLHGLTVHSFWVDEGESHHLATAPDVWVALGATRHPPLYFWLLRGWIGVGGDAEAWLRGLSAALSCGALVAFGLAARWLFGRTSPAAAIGATALYAASAFHVWHGQELRVYAPLDLGTNVALAGLAWALAGGRPAGARVAIAVGTGVAAGAHYLGGLIVPALLVALAIGRPAGWLGHAVTAIVAALAWVPVFAALIPVQLDAPLGYTANLGLRAIAETPVRHLVTALADLPEAMRVVPYALGALVLTGFVSTALAASRTRERVAWIALAWFAVPVGLALALCLVGPSNFLPRYVLVASPGVALVTAFGLVRLRPRALGVVALVASVGCVASVTVAHKRGNLREDFRAASAALRAAWRPGDRVTIVTGTARAFGEGAVRYYVRDRADILASLDAPADATAPPGGRLHVIYRRAPYATPDFRALSARVPLAEPSAGGHRVEYRVSIPGGPAR